MKITKFRFFFILGIFLLIISLSINYSAIFGHKTQEEKEIKLQAIALINAIGVKYKSINEISHNTPFDGVFTNYIKEGESIEKTEFFLVSSGFKCNGVSNFSKSGENLVCALDLISNFFERIIVIVNIYPVSPNDYKSGVGKISSSISRITL